MEKIGEVFIRQSLNLAAADFERWRANLVRGQQ